MADSKGNSTTPSGDSGAETNGAESVKEKFRQALEKKNAAHHATVDASQKTKINHVQGSASTKREFRRKSG